MSERLPDLERTLRASDLVAYGGATWDHHRLHHDTEYAAVRGLRAPVVDGQMLGALMASQVVRHYGPRAFLSALSFRLRSMVFAGDTVRCEAEAERVGDIAQVALRMHVGGRLVAEGDATVRV